MYSGMRHDTDLNNPNWVFSISIQNYDTILDGKLYINFSPVNFQILIFFGSYSQNESYWDLVTQTSNFLLGVASQNLQYEYVVLFMKNTVSETSTPQTVEVYVASRSQQTVTVTIDNPNGGLITSSTFSLTPDEVRMVDLPALSRQDDPLDNKAIRVVGSGDIIVYAMNRNLFSTDGLTVFSTEQVGMEYYAMAYTPSEFDTQIGEFRPLLSLT